MEPTVGGGGMENDAVGELDFGVPAEPVGLTLDAPGPTAAATCELPALFGSASPSGTVDERGRWAPRDD